MNGELLATFTVQGEPVSKSRARFTKRGSKTYAYTPQKTLDGELAVARAFEEVAGDYEVRGDVTFRVEAEFHNGTRQRRDVDNMVKLILDGLNEVAWQDDSQVMEIEACKRFVARAEARTVVRIFLTGALEVPTSDCVRCGTPFRTYESWATNPNGKKYCSAECCYRHRVERRQRTCQQCGRGFLAWGESKETKFCSVACKAAHGRVELTCDACQTRFTKARSAVRKTNYCTPECQVLGASNRRSVIFPGVCDTCGAGTTRKEYRRCGRCKRSGT